MMPFSLIVIYVLYPFSFKIFYFKKHGSLILPYSSLNDDLLIIQSNKVEPSVTQVPYFNNSRKRTTNVSSQEQWTSVCAKNTFVLNKNFRKYIRYMCNSEQCKKTKCFFFKLKIVFVITRIDR